MFTHVCSRYKRWFCTLIYVISDANLMFLLYINARVDVQNPRHYLDSQLAVSS